MTKAEVLAGAVNQAVAGVQQTTNPDGSTSTVNTGTGTTTGGGVGYGTPQASAAASGIMDAVNIGKEATAGYDAASDILVQNLTNPKLPTGATQTFTPMTVQPGELTSTDVTTSPAFVPAPASVVQTLQTTPGALVSEYTSASDRWVGASTYGASTAASLGNIGYAGSPDVQAMLTSAPPGVVAEQMLQMDDLVARQGIAQQVDIDAFLSNINTQPQQMQAVVATLSEQELVTGQLSNLLAGLEGGNVPNWAKPIVEQVEGELERRGIGKSNVARDALFNAIISAAAPLAQSNAQAIQQRSNMNLGFLNNAEQFNAQLRQEMQLSVNDKVALFVGQNTSLRQQMELANLDAASRADLANLEYEFAVNKTNMDAAQLAKLENMRAELQVRLSNQNVQAQFGMAEMSNQQQSLVLSAQIEANRLLTNAASKNAAAQFNASSQNQVNLFNASMQSQVEQYNSTVLVNATNLDATMAFQREQFNASMYNVIEQSNVNWMRQVNTVNTAGENAVNQANATNMFNLSSYALNTIWQEARDNANFATGAVNNFNEYMFRTMIANMQSDQADAAQKSELFSTLGSWFEAFISD